MRLRLLPFSWFNLKLGMINSFLVVCFTMVQKYLGRRNFTYHVVPIKQHLGKNVLHLQYIQEKILQ